MWHNILCIHTQYPLYLVHLASAYKLFPLERALNHISVSQSLVSEKDLHLFFSIQLMKAVRCSSKLWKRCRVSNAWVRSILSNYGDCVDFLEVRKKDTNIRLSDYILLLSPETWKWNRPLKVMFLKAFKAVIHYPAESISLKNQNLCMTGWYLVGNKVSTFKWCLTILKV